MDYSRRPYTASVGPSAAVNDRVSYNLNRAESLLDEPDNGFSIGGNFGAASGTGYGMGGGGGIGSGIERQPLSGQGTGNFIAARSNYTGSDMGDSDTHSNINSQSRPKWGQQPTLGGGLGSSGIGSITEIGTIEVAGGGRRGQRFAGGGSSNHSGSMHAARDRNPPSSMAGSKLFAGASGTGAGFNDILDNEMNRPVLNRGRSTNLLSDAGSKYGGDDDEMSHYMG